ncbi:MAG: DUF429 domain-containing protein [Aquificaceae bacterium]|nr:DUF429 domain-containing protein [Aquificaceae bacterium]
MLWWDEVLGIDLAGSPRRRSGYAYWNKGKLYVGVLYEDRDIIELAKGFSHVFIDAPLSIPAGRNSLDEIGPHFRECDLLLRRLGFKFFPVTLGPMRMLTERGMRLAGELKAMGIKSFETLPGALYDTFGIKRKDRAEILNFYKGLGLEMEDRKYSQDELDAVACWLSGVCYLMGKAQEFSGKDGTIVVGGRECFAKRF